VVQGKSNFLSIPINYQLFKEQTGVTPSEFRKNLINISGDE